MTIRIGTRNRKTRHLMTKNYRKKGKIGLSKFFQEIPQDTRVALVAEPAYQKGMFHPRFHGRVGVVKGTQGDCYRVEFKDKKKDKVAIVHPVHLKVLTA